MIYDFDMAACPQIRGPTATKDVRHAKSDLSALPTANHKS
jgi:hypothetical protein